MQLSDGSINEQCNQFAECDIYAAFGAAGKVMWNAEYINGSGTSGCDSTEYENRYCDANTMKSCSIRVLT
jgi:hypothetical protein